MARVRLPRSKLYRKRRYMPSGRRPARIGLRSMFSPLRGAMRRNYFYKQVILNPTALGPIAVPAGSPTFLKGYSFNLGQVGGNLASFVQLYDQYCISKVVYQLVPNFNSSDNNTPVSGGNLGMVATCIDYDDANAPGAFGDILQYQNCKMHRTGKIITRVIKPTANFVVDAVGGALTSKQSPWLDINNVSVPHYGIKLGITSSGADQNFEVIVKYYLQFRQVK